MNDTPFRQHSITTAQRFLQTVVVVDDQASFTETETEEKVDPSEVIEPDSMQAKLIPAHQLQQAPLFASQHGLNAKEMGDAFADRGLVCSILRPEFKAEETRDAVIDRTMKAAHRADVLILDWQINGEDDEGDDQGRITKDIILKILQNEDGRLRLIAIYTGEPRIASIVSSIEKHLKENSLNPKRIGDDKYSLQIDHARIEVYCKENAAAANPADRRKSVSELPDALIANFSDITGGLISNFAVDAIWAVRENTYNLLTKLHKDLSGPYLVQHALTQSEDAFEFLVNLVAAELHSMLSEYITENKLIDAIEKWLTEDKEWVQRHGEIPNKTFSVEDIKALLLKGKIADAQKRRDKGFKQISQLFCGNDAARLNAELAMLTTLRSRYGDKQHAPFLTLGTIIEEIVGDDKQKNYLLCIQPRCDSVRLIKETSFPFLFLEPSTAEGEFNVVVRNGEQETIYLKAITKPSMCRVIAFTPNSPDLGVIRAQRDDAKALWFPEVERRRHRYLNELKEGYAQRVVNSFASEITRVGLNELEWLRRSAKKS